jgi:hypothetical protein
MLLTAFCALGNGAWETLRKFHEVTQLGSATNTFRNKSSETSTLILFPYFFLSLR